MIDGRSVSSAGRGQRCVERVDILGVVHVLDVPVLGLEARSPRSSVNEIDVVPSIVMWLSS